MFLEIYFFAISNKSVNWVFTVTWVFGWNPILCIDSFPRVFSSYLFSVNVCCIWLAISNFKIKSLQNRTFQCKMNVFIYFVTSSVSRKQNVTDYEKSNGPNLQKRSTQFEAFLFILKPSDLFHYVEVNLLRKELEKDGRKWCCLEGDRVD